MEFGTEELEGVYLITAEPFIDDRGAFWRHYCEREFGDHGIATAIKQCNVSENRSAYTLRGLHYQIPPHAEGKTLSCFRGAIYDVVVDLRPYSKTYLKWIGVELNESDRRAIHIPPGCANAFLTLEDNSIIYYLCSNSYNPEAERGVRYDDPLFQIEWPAMPAVISEKDASHPDYVPELRKSEFARI